MWRSRLQPWYCERAQEQGAPVAPHPQLATAELLPLEIPHQWRRTYVTSGDQLLPLSIMLSRSLTSIPFCGQ